MLRKILGILVFLIVLGCSSDDPVNSDNVGQGNGGNDKIASHPRLLLLKDGEREIKSVIYSQPELNKAHKRMMDVSRIYLSKPVLEYDIVGNRLLDTSKEALKRIFNLSYAYRMTGDVSFARRAEIEMKNVCGFPDWNPSHFLDVAEMTMAVAIGYDWLYDWLSDDTKKLLRSAIMTKGLQQAENTKNAWFYNSTSNWNSVCNAGLVYGALAIYETYPEKCQAIIDKCIETNVKALEVYGPDGGYPEGQSYWIYGGSFEAMLLAALESAMGSDFGLSETPGFMQSSRYVQYMECPSGQSFNYSDCTTAVDVNPVLFWFANKFGEPSLVCLELEKIAGETVRWGDGRLLPMLIVYGAKLNLKNLQPPVDNYWFSRGKTPVFVYRTWDKGVSAVYLGVKGGSPSTDHAHMDGGSFMYERFGQRWSCDIQRQNYISLQSQGVDLFNMTQKSPRWDLLRIGNLGHSTLTVNGEKHLVTGYAEIIEVYKTAGCKGAKVDMSSLLSGRLEKAVRTVTLDASDNLTVTDCLTTLPDRPAEVRWQMMTPAEAKITDDKTITLTLGGHTMKLSVDAGVLPVEMHVWSNKPDNPYEDDNPGTCRVGFIVNLQPGTDAELNITLAP